MNNIKTAFYPFVSNIRVKFAVISLILWLCALASWIYFCPQFLPSTDYLLFSNFDSMPRKDANKGQLLIEPWHQITKGVVWESGDGYLGSACIKLIADGEKRPFLKWTLSNPQRYAFLGFRGKMRSENIVVGENEWNTGRFLVYFTDKEGRGRWEYPHVAVRLVGTNPWQEYSKIIPVPEFAKTANVVIQNSGKSGTIWCDDISLTPFHVNPAYVVFKNIFGISGIALFIILIFISDLRRKGGQLPLILMATILLGAIASNNYFEMIAANLHTNEYVVKKLGHLFLFFILGLVSTRRIGARLETPGRPSLRLPYPVLIFGGLLLFAAITEFVQVLTVDRSPRLMDLSIDMIGGIIGISIAWFLIRRKKS